MRNEYFSSQGVWYSQTIVSTFTVISDYICSHCFHINDGGIASYEDKKSYSRLVPVGYLRYIDGNIRINA